MQQTLGFGLNASIQTGPLGIRQTISTTCKVSYPILTNLAILTKNSVLSYYPSDISPFPHFPWSLAEGHANVSSTACCGIG